VISWAAPGNIDAMMTDRMCLQDGDWLDLDNDRSR
jgi:hypothetical protein